MYQINLVLRDHKNDSLNKVLRLNATFPPALCYILMHRARKTVTEPQLRALSEAYARGFLLAGYL